MISFPVHVKELEDWVPHRPPMRWIEEVLWANATEGECRARISADGFYFSSSGIRPTSMIEWIAQAYAFVRAAQVKAGLVPAAEKPKRVFLVAIQNARFEYLKNPRALEGLEVLHIRVGNERDFGSLALIEGVVRAPDGTLLATTKLKVFGD